MNKIFFMNLWKWKCNIPESSFKKNVMNYEDLKKTEWSNEFETLCRNRLIMGAMRYGRLNAKNKAKYDRIKSCISRLEKYNETGNKEHLVDVSNLCLCEFIECAHPKAHFESIDDGEHTKIIEVNL